MSITSGFFNSLNGDRRYTAEQMSAIFNGIINDGVFSNIGTAFAVGEDTGDSVTIGVGRAWFNGIWVNNDALTSLSLSPSEVLIDRIDAVVIEINRTESVRKGDVKVVNGIPSSTPQRPSLTNTDDIHQYPLAYIYRPAGSEKVTQANITNMIGSSACPYITGILQVQDIDKIVAQWQSQFNIWFDSLDVVLDDNVATNLANKIIELDSRMDQLAKDGSMYSDLADSDGNPIKDSYGNAIVGRTIFTEQGGGGGSTTIIEESKYEVGDIRTTRRTDLDGSWLLCNGARIYEDEYPELAEVLGDELIKKDISQLPADFIDVTSIDNRSNDYFYPSSGYDFEDYFVLTFSVSISGGSNYTAMKVKDKTTGNWRSGYIELPSSEDFSRCGKIVQIGNEYILWNTRSSSSINSSQTTIELVKTTNFIDFTTFTITLNTSVGASCYLHDIVVNDSYIFLHFSDSYYNGTSAYHYMYYSTSLQNSFTRFPAFSSGDYISNGTVKVATIDNYLLYFRETSSWLYVYVIKDPTLSSFSDYIETIIKSNTPSIYNHHRVPKIYKFFLNDAIRYAVVLGVYLVSSDSIETANSWVPNSITTFSTTGYSEDDILYADKIIMAAKGYSNNEIYLFEYDPYTLSAVGERVMPVFPDPIGSDYTISGFYFATPDEFLAFINHSTITNSFEDTIKATYLPAISTEEAYDYIKAVRDRS